MRALYLGATEPESTACHRAHAMRRLGMEVVHIDPMAQMKHRLQGLEGALHYRTGYLLLSPLVNRWLRHQLASMPKPDVVWVDSGELLSNSSIRLLRSLGAPVILFNHDDPTGARDRLRFMGLRTAIPSYDLCIAVRPENVDEYTAYGARSVMFHWRTYDELQHQVDNVDRPVPERMRSDVVFVGGCHKNEGRDRMMLDLIEAGIDAAIWGDGWQRSPLWPQLASHWRGPSLAGQDYVDALRGAKLCLGMVSKANRDLHTTRTMEIPAAGGLLCAQRTADHQALYREGDEAVFWSSVQECVARCRELVADPVRRERIRLAGYARVRANKVGNEDLIRAALARMDLAAPFAQV